MAGRYNTNSVVFTGWLTHDPELRGPGASDDNQGDSVWTILRVAVNKRTADGTRAIYEDVKVWNGAARFFVDKARKGSFVAVEGSLDQYDRPDGGRWHFIAGESVELIGTRSEADAAKDDSPAGSQ